MRRIYDIEYIEHYGCGRDSQKWHNSSPDEYIDVMILDITTHHMVFAAGTKGLFLMTIDPLVVVHSGEFVVDNSTLDSKTAYKYFGSPGIGPV
jgi:hypothetical protein